jgi:hypothetical protein
MLRLVRRRASEAPLGVSKMELGEENLQLAAVRRTLQQLDALFLCRTCGDACESIDVCRRWRLR